MSQNIRFHSVISYTFRFFKLISIPILQCFRNSFHSTTAAPANKTKSSFLQLPIIIAINSSSIQIEILIETDRRAPQQITNAMNTAMITGTIIEDGRETRTLTAPHADLKSAKQVQLTVIVHEIDLARLRLRETRDTMSKTTKEMAIKEAPTDSSVMAPYLSECLHPNLDVMASQVHGVQKNQVTQMVKRNSSEPSRSQVETMMILCEAMTNQTS